MVIIVIIIALIIVCEYNNSCKQFVDFNLLFLLSNYCNYCIILVLF